MSMPPTLTQLMILLQGKTVKGEGTMRKNFSWDQADTPANNKRFTETGRNCYPTFTETQREGTENAHMSVAVINSLPHARKAASRGLKKQFQIKQGFSRVEYRTVMRVTKRQHFTTK